MPKSNLIPEGLHPIMAITVGVAGNAASTFDWINCANAHALYCVVHVKRATAAPNYMVGYSASNYAGTGSSQLSTGIDFWTNTHTYDRFVAKTTSNSSTVTASATGWLTIVARLDTAALPSSHPFAAFALRSSSQAGNLHSATYYLEQRYKGVSQFLATTSST